MSLLAITNYKLFIHCYFYILYSVKVKLQNKLSPIQSPGSSVPTDITFKLSDGSIHAHKMILAFASPIFCGMFFGEGKMKNETVADLPKEKCKIMQLLIDFVCRGSCEIDSLDETLPLLELFNHYEVSVMPLKYAVGEVILPQLDSSNYLTLLPKYVSVMSKESHKKAADKVMSYTNNDFVTKFDKTKNLPEEIMLPLLQSNEILVCEVNILEFLIKWHEYQTKQLGKPLQLLPQLFSSIRYSLIIPRLLFETLSACEYSAVGKHSSAALDYIYNNRKSLAKNDGSDNEVAIPIDRVRVTARIDHIVQHRYYNQFKFVSETEFSATVNNMQSYIVESTELANGTYAFTISNKTQLNQNQLPPKYLLQIMDSTDQNVSLSTAKANDGALMVICVYDDDVFIKIKEDDVVKSTCSAIGLKPFKYRVHLSGQNWHTITFHFQIHSVV